MGVWLAYPVGQAFLSLIILLIAVMNRRKREDRVLGLMMLPKDFGVPACDCMERSVSTVDEVIGLSQEVGTFCGVHDIERNRANRLALCVEEMGTM